MSLLQNNKSFTLIRTLRGKNLVSAQQGFTLIEMLIVLSIIGMLIAVTLFGVGGARESTRNAQRKSDLETIRSAFELYKSDCGSYPATMPAVGAPLEASCVLGTSVPTPTPSLPSVLATIAPTPTPGPTSFYIASWPGDPISAHTYRYEAKPIGGPYVSYHLCAFLEGTTGTSGCTGNCGTNPDGSGISCNYGTTNP